MIYYFHDVVVFIYFNSNPNCRQKLPHTTWAVPSNTVTGIDVSLRRPLLVSETDIDLPDFKKVKGDYDLMDRYHYLNADNSFAIEAGAKHVVGYHYQIGNEHKKLLCEPSTHR